jgi:hypothetical protein
VVPHASDDDDEITTRLPARACVGGIAAWAHDALGPGWVDADGKGATVQDAKAIADVAQRSLGDVFEQLERIGAFGRERCRGYGYGPISPALRVHRDEAIKLLELADLALSYARVHLTFLEPGPALRSAVRTAAGFAIGDEVSIDFLDGSRERRGTVTDASDAADELEVQCDDGARRTVPVDQVTRRAAP